MEPIETHNNKYLVGNVGDESSVEGLGELLELPVPLKVELAKGEPYRQAKLSYDARPMGAPNTPEEIISNQLHYRLLLGTWLVGLAPEYLKEPLSAHLGQVVIPRIKKTLEEMVDRFFSYEIPEPECFKEPWLIGCLNLVGTNYTVSLKMNSSKPIQDLRVRTAIGEAPQLIRIGSYGKEEAEFKVPARVEFYSGIEGTEYEFTLRFDRV